MDLNGAYELASKYEEKYQNNMKKFISTNQKRFQAQQKVLSRNSKIETPKNMLDERRDELNDNLRIAEFKNLQSGLGSEFSEYFAKLDLKIIINHEKGNKLMRDTLRKAVLLKQKKRYSKVDITAEFLSRIQKTETDMKKEILKRLRFLINFGNFEKQNLQLSEFDGRLKHVEEKMQIIQTESKTMHSPSFKASIDRKLDKTEIYAREEIVQSFFG